MLAHPWQLLPSTPWSLTLGKGSGLQMSRSLLWNGHGLKGQSPLQHTTAADMQSSLKLQAEILQWLPEVQASHSIADAYILVGHALQLLEHSWSPTVFMQANKVWPDRNITPTTPDMWARVLLLHGLGISAGHDSNARDLPESHLYTSRLETASCAAIKALLQIFNQLSKLA